MASLKAWFQLWKQVLQEGKRHISADIWVNCAFYDTSMPFDTQLGHALWGFLDIGPLQFWPIATTVAIFQNGQHHLLLLPISQGLNHLGPWFWWLILHLQGQGIQWSEWVISKFNGTSTPKGSYCAKTGLNCQVTSWKKSSNEQGNAHYGPRPAKVAG